ncbi:MAG: OmpA family protein [Proteobacteria bacterium]|nr:OmpA family protein [Pseudomonadota bacterium]
MLLKKSILSTSLLLSLLGSACTDQDKKIEEVVQVDAKKAEHDFTVDEKTGKLEFKAEIVYFGFDDYSLTAEGQARLDAIAAFMKAHATEKLNVEGHCDNRGSVEYNLSLGQRRAESVRKYLETLGIGADRLQAISFGSERPAVAGAGEEIWSKNRRAEFAFAH